MPREDPDELEEERRERLTETERLKELRLQQRILRNPVFRATTRILIDVEEDVAAQIGDPRHGAVGTHKLAGALYALRGLRLNYMTFLLDNMRAQPKPGAEGELAGALPPREVAETDDLTL